LGVIRCSTLDYSAITRPKGLNCFSPFFSMEHGKG